MRASGVARSGSAIIRPVTSEMPPGANGTIIVIGRGAFLSSGVY
jgi:hypothetical protein